MRVAVVGTGYVGLVSGACLAAEGHDVTCVDVVPARAAAVASGDCPVHEDGLPALVRSQVAARRLTATTDLAAALEGAAVAMVAVGTPEGQGGADLSAVASVAAALGGLLRGRGDFPVVAVKSTVPPGTTDTLVRRAVEAASGLRAGLGFGLAMNPEFLSQGTAVRDFRAPDRIVVGALEARSAAVMAELYRPFQAPVLTMSLREAEMAKYCANALQATLISFANEVAVLCEATPGCDHARVMAVLHRDRMLDGPMGGRAGATRFLLGGIGFGGSCFPKDLAALAAYGRAAGAELPLIRAVAAVNAARPAQVAELLAVLLGGLEGRRVAVLGLAFKPGTDDLRASPGLALAGVLAGRGAEVCAHDPLEAVCRAVPFPTAETVEEALAGADAAVVATAWPDYAACDWARAAAAMRVPVLLDGRCALDGVPLPPWLRRVRIGLHPIPLAEETA